MKIKSFLLIGMILLIGIGFVCSENYPVPFVSGTPAEKPNCENGLESYYDDSLGKWACPLKVYYPHYNIPPTPTGNIQVGNIQPPDLPSSMGTTGTTTTTSGESDSFLIERTSTKYHVGDNISTLFSNFVSSSPKNLSCEGLLLNGTCHENNSTFEFENRTYFVFNGSLSELLIKNLSCNGLLLNQTCYENNSTFEFEGKNYSITNGSMHELLIINDSLEDFKLHKENINLSDENKKESFFGRFLKLLRF
ncbi:MAG TPA: hypothetical protein HA283_02685 [Nanoarchaeota archaeon]|nr:hypothetical protein [Nanoarchaeota archaeon]HIH63180.1 hypothetical protein [Nanoarchaeota archaeon]HIJ09203.1 hypothetical protein [Nanoarchaeota archaeon]